MPAYRLRHAFRRYCPSCTYFLRWLTKILSISKFCSGSLCSSSWISHIRSVFDSRSDTHTTQCNALVQNTNTPQPIRDMNRYTVFMKWQLQPQTWSDYVWVWPTNTVHVTYLLPPQTLDEAQMSLLVLVDSWKSEHVYINTVGAK